MYPVKIQFKVQEASNVDFCFIRSCVCFMENSTEMFMLPFTDCVSLSANYGRLGGRYSSMFLRMTCVAVVYKVSSACLSPIRDAIVRDAHTSNLPCRQFLSLSSRMPSVLLQQTLDHASSVAHCILTGRQSGGLTRGHWSSVPES